MRVRPTDGEPETARLIRERRGGELRPLDQALLHSAPVAGGWNALLGAIRTQTELSAQVRELVVLRVAALNGAEYEWAAHASLGLAAGLGDGQLAALRREARSGESFTTEQQAVLSLVDAMTRAVQVPDDIFDSLLAHFDERTIVELVATVAAYNMVSRFLVALDITPPESALA